MSREPVVCPSCRREIVLKSDGLCPFCLHDVAKAQDAPLDFAPPEPVTTPPRPTPNARSGKGLWSWLGTGLVLLLFVLKIAARVERARPRADRERAPVAQPAGAFDAAERARQAELAREAERMRETIDFSQEQQRQQQVREAIERAERQKTVAPGWVPPNGPRVPHPEPVRPQAPVPLSPRPAVPRPGPRPR